MVLQRHGKMQFEIQFLFSVSQGHEKQNLISFLDSLFLGNLTAKQQYSHKEAESVMLADSLMTDDQEMKILKNFHDQ